MMILCVIFVVLMMFWLFGGGYVAYQGDKWNPVVFGGHTLIPWICVAILGWLLFNGPVGAPDPKMKWLILLLAPLPLYPPPERCEIGVGFWWLHGEWYHKVYRVEGERVFYYRHAEGDIDCVLGVTSKDQVRRDISGR